MDRMAKVLGVAIVAVALAVGVTAAQDGPSERGLEAQEIVDLCVAQIRGDEPGEWGRPDDRGRPDDPGQRDDDHGRPDDPGARGEEPGLGECVSEMMRERGHDENEANEMGELAQRIHEECVAERDRAGAAHGLGECVSEAMQERQHGQAGERGADRGPDGGPPPDAGPPGGPRGLNR